PRDVQLQSVSVWKRMITNFAGPFNNFILAIVCAIIAAFMMNGIPMQTNQLGHIESNSVAKSAGLKSNDKILAVGNKTTSNWTTLTETIRDNPGKKVDLKVESKGNIKHVTVVPKTIKVSGQKYGQLGIMA